MVGGRSLSIVSLLAIDPGKITGMALYWDHRLHWCADVKHHMMPAVMKHSLPNHCVIELPQIYRSRLSKGDPNDLIPLIIQCGEAKEVMASINGVPPEMVKPREWKGQVPKKVLWRRYKPMLSKEERTKVKGLTDNGQDAVMLGLWWLKKRGLR